jgi:hypothetical protein
MSVQAAFQVATHDAGFTKIWFHLVQDFGTLDKE